MPPWPALFATQQIPQPVAARAQLRRSGGRRFVVRSGRYLGAAAPPASDAVHKCKRTCGVQMDGLPANGRDTGHGHTCTRQQQRLLIRTRIHPSSATTATVRPPSPLLFQRLCSVLPPASRSRSLWASRTSRSAAARARPQHRGADDKPRRSPSIPIRSKRWPCTLLDLMDVPQA